MMFENIEELLKNTGCRVVSASSEHWLCWGILRDGERGECWFVIERKRYAKKNKILYEGNDIREAMQFMK